MKVKLKEKSKEALEVIKINTLIGNALKRIRIERGKCRKQVAVPVGITHQQLEKYEDGRNRISSGMLCVLAKELGVDVSEFYRVDGIDNPLPDPTECSRVHLEIAREAMGKPPEVLYRILSLMKVMPNKEEVANLNLG